MAPIHPQDEVHKASLTDPERFWAHQAQQLHWHRQPDRTLSRTTKTLRTTSPSSSGSSGGSITHPHWTWFPNGEISNCHNCVDRHVSAGRGEAVAIIWDSPVTNTKQKFTYRQVLEEVETLAGVLREEGVERGDVVVIYMPMIPAVLFACLAVNRLGAIHAVVFGGFSAASLAQRLDQAKPKLILTSSCGIEGAKGPVDYKPLVQGALAQSTHQPSRVIIWQREQKRWGPLEGRERDWQELVGSAKKRGVKADVVPVKSDDIIYLIYTSGTTGLPKGVARNAAGHAVNLNFSIRYLFNIKPGDVMFCASDIGWVVGHSYILYAPLLAGATTVLFEGKPVGTPDAGAFWRILEEHKVNALFTAPTALRAIRRDDPENQLFEKRGQRGGLKHLRNLFLAGERSEPQIVDMYRKLLAKYCAEGATVIDNWWSSESGSPISGIATVAAAGKDFHSTQKVTPLAIKIGSAGKPLPGWDVRVVDDDGVEVNMGTMGNIVLNVPLAPSGFTTLWKDEERFYKGYLKRFESKWMDTGDAGMIDQDGYVHVMSRSDDIINVAAHRFSTGRSPSHQNYLRPMLMIPGAIEQAIASHPTIAECCVVGVPDALKGQLPFAFITLSTPAHPTSAIPSDTLTREIQASVRDQIGAIAALGGMIQGKGIIPRTRSGKTLRRVLKELVENAVHGEFDAEVNVPATIEDMGVVEVARGKIKDYFVERGAELHRATEGRRAKL